MTFDEISSPPVLAGANLPTSTAELTSATSPSITTVTKPDPTLFKSTKRMFAAFAIESNASTAAVSPLVSIKPIALIILFLSHLNQNLADNLLSYSYQPGYMLFCMLLFHLMDRLHRCPF